MELPNCKNCGKPLATVQRRVVRPSQVEWAVYAWDGKEYTYKHRLVLKDPPEAREDLQCSECQWRPGRKQANFARRYGVKRVYTGRSKRR